MHFNGCSGGEGNEADCDCLCVLSARVLRPFRIVKEDCDCLYALFCPCPILLFCSRLSGLFRPLQALVRSSSLSAPLAEEGIACGSFVIADAVFVRPDCAAPGMLGEFRDSSSLAEQSSLLFAAARVRSSPCGDFHELIEDQFRKVSFGERASHDAQLLAARQA